MISSGVNTPGFLLIVDSVSACYEVMCFAIWRLVRSCNAVTTISKSTAQSAHPLNDFAVGLERVLFLTHPS